MEIKEKIKASKKASEALGTIVCVCVCCVCVCVAALGGYIPWYEKL